VIRCTILGSGTSLPVPDRAPPGYLIHGGGRTVLVDPGPGAVHRAGVAGVDLATLEVVCVSHLHLDHCNDLGQLLFTLRNPRLARTAPLVVAGGPGLTRHLEGLVRLHGGWVDADGYSLRVQSDARWRFAAGTLGIQAGPVDHITGSVGFRFMGPDGATLVYTGDTTGDDDTITLARGADCLLMECSSPDDAPIPKHSTPADVIRVARAARVRRVVLTHFYPGIDATVAAAQVADATGIPCTAAVDGQVLEVVAPAPDDPAFRVA